MYRRRPRTAPLALPALFAATISLAALSAALAQGGSAAQKSPRPAPRPAPSPVPVRPAASQAGALLATDAVPGLPPLSLVRRGEGRLGDRLVRTTLYSRDLNRVTCQSETPDSFLLGTPLGLKRVSKRDGRGRRTERVYTTADGLPSDYVVAALADGPRAWCVVLTDAEGGAVRSLPGGSAALPPPINPAPGYEVPASGKARLALCLLDAGADRWRVVLRAPIDPVQKDPPPPSPWMDWEGAAGEHAALLASGDDLWFTPGRAPAGSPLLYRLPRSGAGEPRPAAPEPSLFPPADASGGPPGHMGARSMVVRGGAVLLATEYGLLRHDAASGAWARLLPEEEVFALGDAAGEGPVWLAARPRNEPGVSVASFEKPYRVRTDPWRLFRFDPAKPDSGPEPLLPFVPGDPTPGGQAEQDRRSRPAPNPGTPVGVRTGPDGAVWVTTAPNADFGAPVGFGARFVPDDQGLGARLLRYDTKAGDWARYAVYPGSDYASSAPGNAEQASKKWHEGVNARPAEGVDVPEAAVLPLALHRPSRNVTWYSGFPPRGLNRGETTRLPDGTVRDSRRFWVRRLFRHWDSPSVALPMRPTGVASIPSSAPNAAPAAGWSTVNGVVSRSAADGKRELFPIKEPVRLRLTPERLAELGADLVVSTFHGVYLLGPSSPEPRLLPLPRFLRYGGFGADRIVAVPARGGQPGRIVLAASDGALLDYEPQTRRFRVAAEFHQTPTLIGPAGTGSVWARVQSGTGAEYYRVPLPQGGDADAAPPERVPVEPPADVPRPGGGQVGLGNAVGASGDVLWFTFERQGAQSGRGYELRGYDAAAKRWTPPLPVSTVSFSNRTAVLTAGGGGDAFALSASAGGESLVYRYNAAAGAWEAEAPRLPPAPLVSSAPTQSADARAWEDVRLVAATDSDLWVVARPRFGPARPDQGRRLWRWSRSAKTWTAAELPEGLATGGFSDPQSAVAGGRLYLGQSYVGLWAFDPVSGRWEAPTVAAVPQSDPFEPGGVRAAGPSLSVQSVAAGSGAVWASVRTENSPQVVVGRLDPEKRAWTLWGDDDLPGLRQLSQITPHGDGAWLRTHPRLYRYDAKGAKWEWVDAGGFGEDGQYQAPTVYADGPVAWLVGYRRRAEPETAAAGTGPRTPPAELTLWRSEAGGRELAAFPLPPAPLEGPWMLYTGFNAFTNGSEVPLIEPDALYFARATQMLRFDRATARWDRLGFPADHPVVLATEVTRGADGDLYLRNLHQTVRCEEVGVKQARGR